MQLNITYKLKHDFFTTKILFGYLSMKYNKEEKNSTSLTTVF